MVQTFRDKFWNLVSKLAWKFVHWAEGRDKDG